MISFFTFIVLAINCIMFNAAYCNIVTHNKFHSSSHPVARSNIIFIATKSSCCLKVVTFCLVDVMLGNPVTEDIAALIAAMKNGPEEEQWTMEREECVAQLVQHCKQLLLTDEEECMCGWALVDPFYRYMHFPLAMFIDFEVYQHLF